MGFLRKITGVQGQIDAAKQSARTQAAAAQSEAQANANAAVDQARQAAEQQALLQAREQASTQADALLSVAPETAEVQLDSATAESATSVRRKRRATFGAGVSGVAI